MPTATKPVAQPAVSSTAQDVEEEEEEEEEEDDDDKVVPMETSADKEKDIKGIHLIHKHLHKSNLGQL